MQELTLLSMWRHSHTRYLSKQAILHTGNWLILMATPDDIKNILGSNEKVELYIEEKIYHPRINIESVIITNERIIFRHPHALGLKKDYTDYSYRDITNVTLDKGILRSTIKLTLKHGEEIRENSKKENIWIWITCQMTLQKKDMASSGRILANSNRPFQLDMQLFPRPQIVRRQAI